MPTKRKPVRKSSQRNPSRKPAVDPRYVDGWRQSIPRGTELYGIIRSAAASGTKVVELVFAPRKGEINRVPPALIRAAGYRYNDKKNGAVATGSGYDRVQHIGEGVAMFLYGDVDAFRYGSTI